MQLISVKDTRDNLSDIIELVAGGKKSFIITKFGKPKAQIVPVKKKTKTAQNKKWVDDTFGMWADREDMKDSAKWVADLRASWRKRYE